MSTQSKTCFTKKGKGRDYYNTRERAEYKLQRLIEKVGADPLNLHVYLCNVCGKYHIGTTLRGAKVRGVLGAWQ